MKIIDNIKSMPRSIKSSILLASDAIFLIIAILISFTLRLGYFYFPPEPLENSVTWLILLSPLIGIPIFLYFGLYREVIRYISAKPSWTIVKAVGLYSLLWGLISMLSGASGFPRSVVLINFMVTLISIMGSRLLAKYLLSQVKAPNYKLKNNQKTTRLNKILIYGAGVVGRQLAFGLKHRSDYEICGFIDDDKSIQGRNMIGHPVISLNELGATVKSKDITEILLAMPSITRQKRNQILKKLLQLQVRVKTLPSLSQLANGDSSIDEIKDLDIDDLLMRKVVTSDDKPLISVTKGKIVMVTGAGGSIGSEICRQVLKRGPKILLLLEISEFALYEIQQELEALCFKINSNKKFEFLPKIIPLLGSVQDENRMTDILKTWAPNILYHTAAYKHVPMVESNLSEGIKNNVFGTYTLAKVAIEQQLENFILISTDKAVNPTNSMGASKRVAELILQAVSAEQSIEFKSLKGDPFRVENITQFSMVRFGNVLGSSGSVVPLFRKQLKNGGPITLTHKDITRYFMTISEASQLVMHTAAMEGKSKNASQVYVLDMGKPIRIIDLARRMVALSGMRVKEESFPQGDIEIKITGLRKGEKLFEELLIGNNPIKTSNPKILKASEDFFSWSTLQEKLHILLLASNKNDSELIVDILRELVIGYKPEENIADSVFIEKNKI